MPTPDQIVGDIAILSETQISTGFLVEVTIQDLVTGNSIKETLFAPKTYLDMTATDKAAWVRSAVINRVASWIDREVSEIIEMLRRGDNPLRNPDGTTKDYKHLMYSEAASKVYVRLYKSTVPEDRILAAKMAQTLTDDELSAITGLDAQGVQDLRAQADAALQAAALMQQAGGSW